MIIGYARVSTEEQKTDMQIDDLKKAGCVKIFEEKQSGRKNDRPELQKCLNFVREGDVLVVWKLDRLGRSLSHLVQTVKNLGEKGVMFMSLKENIDTSTPTGKLVFHIFAALAEFECEIIRERTKSGIKAAISRGIVVGRPRKISNVKEAQIFAKMCESGASAREIRTALGISDTTYHRLKRSLLSGGISEMLARKKNININNLITPIEKENYNQISP